MEQKRFTNQDIGISGLVLIDPMNVKFVDRFGLDNLNAVTPYFPNPTENFEKAGNRMVDFSSESFAAMRGKELPKQIPVILITSGNPPHDERTMAPMPRGNDDGI
jgi:hypothetical protein